MFTSDYYSLSIEQVKRVCRYIPGLIMGDFRLVIYRDSEGYFHAIRVEEDLDMLHIHPEHDLGGIREEIQREFDEVCEMFDPYIPLKKLCESNLEIKEAAKDILYREFFNGHLEEV